MRKVFLGFVIILFPFQAVAEDHDYRTTILSAQNGSSEVLIIDSKSGDAWEFMEQPGGGSTIGGTWVRYIGKLIPGAKFGDLIIDHNDIPPIPPAKH